MARNEEKALTLFSKWQSFKTGQSVLGSKKTIISSEPHGFTRNLEIIL